MRQLTHPSLSLSSLFEIALTDPETSLFLSSLCAVTSVDSETLEKRSRARQDGQDTGKAPLGAHKNGAASIEFY